jgi:hypothetical protein
MYRIAHLIWFPPQNIVPDQHILHSPRFLVVVDAIVLLIMAATALVWYFSIKTLAKSIENSFANGKNNKLTLN